MQIAPSFTQTGKQVAQKATSWYASPLVPWGIIGFGVLVRLAAYLHNPSLWVDEAALALSIVNRSFSGLLEPLAFHTGAPLGFLMLERLAVEVLGNNEYALRLLPFLAGVGSLFLLYPVAKRYITPQAVPIALLLFATSTSLVRYSNQVKQYSSDVFLVLLLLLVSTQVVKQRLAIRWLIIYAIVGAITIWFSFPVVFVLAGAGAVLGFQSLAKREWSKVAQLSIVGAVWLGSFAIFYFISTANEIASNQGIEAQISIESGFVPLPPRSFSDARWYLTTLFDLFDVPAGLTFTGIAALAFLMGGVAIWKTNKYQSLTLLAPVVVTMLVSGAHLYPFSDRWVLFLTPFVLLFVAEGAMFIVAKTRHTYPAIGIALVALLLLHPIASEAFRLVVPRGTEEVRPVLTYITTRWSDGDQLYVYHGARKAFMYYADKFQLDDDNYIIGVSGIDPEIDRKDLDIFVADLDTLRGNDRVWFIFSNVKDTGLGLKRSSGVDEELFFLYHLDNIGTRLDYFRDQNASAYLYDLSETGTVNAHSAEP